MSATRIARPALVAVAVFSAALAAGAEGLCAVVITLRYGYGIASAIAAFAGASALTFLATLALVLPIALLAGGRNARGLFRHGVAATAGSGAALFVATSAAAGAGLLLGLFFGHRLLAIMTPPFAIAGAALSTLAGAFVFGLVVFPLSAGLARRFPAIARSAWVPLVLSIGLSELVFIAVSKLGLSLYFTAAPVALFAGVALSLSPGSGPLLSRATRGATGLAALGATLAAAILVVARLGAIPADARPAIALETPYAANLLSLIFRVSDEDGDGYSPLFFAGDCDDANANINPSAREIPDNGVDENCADGDAPAWIPPEEPTARPEHPTGNNIVLILIDALRPDHLGFAGYERPTSPNIDALREESVYFENAYTIAPSTLFALATTFTGVDARRLPHELPRSGYRLGDGVDTVARTLGEAGYDSAGFTVAYVMRRSASLGQGFVQWESAWTAAEYRDIYLEMAGRTTRSTLAYIDSVPDDGSQPFFVFSHYRCTHGPYQKYPEWDYGDEPIDLYDSSLNHCDAQIGEVLATLEGRRDWDNTTVILFSDHGELFGEFGLHHHSYTVHEPELRIALLARIPGQPAATVETPVTIADIAPTIYELAGVPRPRSLDGWSLFVHLGPAAPRPMDERAIFSFNDMWRARVHRRSRAVIVWPHKYIHDQTTNRRSFYDLEADPQESQDLSEQDPNAAAALAHILEAYGSFD